MKEALKLALWHEAMAKEPNRNQAKREKHEATAKFIKEALAQPNEFNPDWDAMAVMVEEQQRMAKRIEELEAMLTTQTARIVDLQTHIENLEGEG